jgi:hypothetical protein
VQIAIVGGFHYFDKPLIYNKTPNDGMRGALNRS